MGFKMALGQNQSPWKTIHMKGEDLQTDFDQPYLSNETLRKFHKIILKFIKEPE